MAVGVIAIGGQVALLLDPRIPARSLLSALLLLAMVIGLFVMVGGGARSLRKGFRRKNRG